jgi:hypothetical protein
LSAPAANRRPVVAEERVAVAEHDPEADDEERDRGHREHHEVLEEDVDRVLRAAEAGLDERESEVHEEDEERGDEDPQRVEGDLLAGDRLRERLGGGGVRGEGRGGERERGRGRGDAREGEEGARGSHLGFASG